MAERMEIVRGGMDEPQRLEQQRTALTKKYGTERIDSLIEIVLKSRLSADQAVPVGKEKLLMIGAWAEVLEDIPDELLEEYYLRASKAKTNGFPVNALDIVAAWNERSENRRWESLIDPEKQRLFNEQSGRV